MEGRRSHGGLGELAIAAPAAVKASEAFHPRHAAMWDAHVTTATMSCGRDFADHAPSPPLKPPGQGKSFGLPIKTAVGARFAAGGGRQTWDTRAPWWHRDTALKIDRNTKASHSLTFQRPRTITTSSKSLSGPFYSELLLRLLQMTAADSEGQASTRKRQSQGS